MSLQIPSKLWPQLEVKQFFAAAKNVFRSKKCDVRIAPKTRLLGRLLVVVPASVGSAVERNVIKRRVRAVFYENNLRNSLFDWGFFVKPAGKNISYTEIKYVITTCQNNATSQ